MSLRLSLTALAVASVLPCLAQAANQQIAALDTVVVTGARQAQRPEELLATVDVIDREQIEQAGADSVHNLLSRQPGIQITSNGGGMGKAGAIYVRGTNGNHVVVLVDGVRIGSATTGQPALETLPLSQVERIEILRGPASALYGADAVGGVIQIFTKRGNGAPLVEGYAGVGNFGTTQMGAGVSGSEGAWSYAVRAAEYNSHGISAKKGPYGAMSSSKTYNPALDADRDGFRSNSIGGNVGYQLAPGHELRVNVLHIESRNWNDGSGYNAPQGGADVGSDAVTDVVSLESVNQVNELWKSTVRLAQSQDKSRAFYNYNHFNTREDQFLWQNDIKAPIGNLMVGYEFLRQSVDSSTDYTVTARNLSSVMLGWNAEIERNQFQANLRQDHNSQFGDKLTYLLGYGYRITSALRASATVGTSFKAPTLNDLYFIDAWGDHGNPNLKPESARNRELALRYSEAGTKGSLVYYNNKVDNLITWTSVAPTYAYVPIQTGHARIEGWELAGSTLLGNYELSASVDLLNPKDEATGKQLARRAEQSGRLAVTRTFGAFTVGTELIGVGKRFDDAANKTSLGGYGLVNLFGQYQIDRNWRLEARANNLLDKDYTLANGYNTLGANVFVGIRYLSR